MRTVDTVLIVGGYHKDSHINLCYKRSSFNERCVCACIYIYKYVCIYRHTHTHIHIHTYICIYKTLVEATKIKVQNNVVQGKGDFFPFN